MNWGNKLIFVFIGFASLMSFMVYRCILVPVDLASKEYYKDELIYQQVIDAKKTANSLSSDVSLSLSKEYVIIRMPVEMQTLNPTGNIFFYCRSASDKDKNFPLQLGEDGYQRIGIQNLEKADYTVKISWQASKINYYTEQHLMIH